MDKEKLVKILISWRSRLSLKNTVTIFPHRHKAIKEAVEKSDKG